ncbi:HhH-GPD-type base excision DNA repair protein [soil metagenome]
MPGKRGRLAAAGFSLCLTFPLHANDTPDYHRTMSANVPASLPYTGDDEADRLLAQEPLALLIGFVLDQQVPLQKAFSGPLELRRRIGTLDAAQIAGYDTAQLEDVFRTRPALHRFPANMARRTQELCTAILRDYGGDAGRVWREATDGRDLERRLLGLPGIGEMKARTLIAVLAKRFGVRPPGWEEVAPHHPTLADVDSPATLAAYQAGKRAYKAEMRARQAEQASDGDAGR